MLILIFNLILGLCCPIKQQLNTSSDLQLVPTNAKHQNNITKKRFLEIIKWFEDQYQNEVREHSAELKIYTDWEQPIANAVAQRENNLWIIRVFGGIARHRLVTEDAFIFVLCHEMGHHLGGAPHKRHLFKTYWSSVEGQADYYASLKCMRKLFEFSDNEKAISNMDIPDRVHDECSISFQAPQKIALCKRIAMASLSHAQFLNSKNEIHRPVNVNFFDPKVVSKTNTKHPKPQCRLDTSLAGAFCPVSKEIKLSNKDERAGTCHTNLGFTRGLRPRCWYKSSLN